MSTSFLRLLQFVEAVLPGAAHALFDELDMLDDQRMSRCDRRATPFQVTQHSRVAPAIGFCRRHICVRAEEIDHE